MTGIEKTFPAINFGKWWWLSYFDHFCCICMAEVDKLRNFFDQIIFSLSNKTLK